MFERFREDAGRSLTDFTDGDHSRRIYYIVIGGGLAINLLSWVVAIVTPDVIADWIGFAADISDRVKAWLLAFPFWSTFAAAYSALRLRAYPNPTATLADDDLLASYRDTERGEYIRNRVLISLAVAALNTILLVLLFIDFRQK